jgi:hypothetical protein
MKPSVALLVLSLCLPCAAQTGAQEAPVRLLRPYEKAAHDLSAAGLSHLNAYALLSELSGGIGGRLSGSPEAAAAVDWGRATMTRLGFENVHLEPVMVPHWVRGDVESGEATFEGKQEPLTLCALGGSVATDADGAEGEVIEVHSLQDATALGERARGKIVFFNRPMDPTLTNTFEAYGGAVDQRVAGASVAAKVGAVAVLVRSMTLTHDDVPHTGMLSYDASAPRIPAAALSALAADHLSDILKRGTVRVRLKLSCRTLPDVESANVVGEIRGTERPNEVIVIGGHLDSWDKGRGAHDDGAGICHSLEALSLIHRLELHPKRTIRVVLFMNEENGTRGAAAYAAVVRKGEKTIAAIESDSGGFAPHGFGIGSPRALRRVRGWSYLLDPLGVTEIRQGGGGADIEPLGPQGTVLMSLEPESQRYFDYHHSTKDVIDNVNPRELELGAVAMATLAYAIAEAGI